MKIFYTGLLATDHSWAVVGRSICVGLHRIKQNIIAKSSNGINDFGDELRALITTKDITDAAATISYTIPAFYSKLPTGVRLGLYNYETTVMPPRFVRGANDATFIIPASNFAKEIFLMNKIPEDKIRVVPHAIDLLQYNTSVAPTVPNKDEFIFLYVASPHARKHFDILLEAFCNTFSNKDPVRLIIKSKKTNPKRTRHYEIDTVALIEGFKRRYKTSKIELHDRYLPNLAGLYKSANVYISPSGTECFGITLLEAAACGVPIIASNYGGYLDFLNKDNSYLIDVKMKDAPKNMQYWHYAPAAKIGYPDKEQLQATMRHVYEKYDEAKQRAEKALEVVPNYSLEKVAQQYVNIINSLAKKTEIVQETKTTVIKKTIKAQFEKPIFYSDFSNPHQWLGQRRVVKEGNTRTTAIMINNDGKRWDCISAAISVKPKTKYVIEVSAKGLDRKNNCIRVNFYISLKQDFKQVIVPVKSSEWYTYTAEVETGDFATGQKVYFRIWSPKETTPNRVLLRSVRVSNAEEVIEDISVSKKEIKEVKKEKKEVQKSTVSCYSIIKDEASNIGGLLNNIYDAFDQIVLLDGGSTDRTVEVIKSHPDPQKKIELYVDPQPGERYGLQWDQPRRRNYCLEKCACEWVFMIDADERIDGRLKKRIREIVNSGTTVNGFAFPRHNYWGANDKIRVDGTWFPNYGYRLWKNNIGVKYENKPRHCQPVIPGCTSILNQKVIMNNGVFVSLPIHHFAVLKGPSMRGGVFRGNNKDYPTIMELERNIQIKRINDFYLHEGRVLQEKRTPGMIENILFFMNNVDFYSGGRYYLWCLATAMAVNGLKVHIVTNRMPIFSRDFPLPSNMTIGISNKYIVDSDLAFDMVFGTPPDCGRAAIKYAKEHCIPLTCVCMETPNFIREYRLGHDTEDKHWENYKRILPKADYIITMAELPTKKMLEWISTLSKDNVFIIPPAVNENALNQTEKIKETNEIVFISRCVLHKKLDYVMAAAAMVSKRCNCVLNIVGFGDRGRIHALAQRYGATIQVYKNISDVEKFRIIKKSKILISATEYEGFGISPIEGMFCKKPVIVSDLPIFHETLEGNAIYVDNTDIEGLANKIIGLFRDSKKRHGIGQSGFESVVNKYSFAAMKKRLKSFIEQINKKNVLTIENKDIQIKKQSVKVSACIIALNEEEFLPYCLKGIYNWENCHEIVIVEGAVEEYPAKNITIEGHSIDKTIEVVQNFPDPENKIKLIMQNVKWKNKEEQRNQYAARVSGDWMFVIDADEFYTEEDLDKLGKEMEEPGIDLLSFKRPDGIIHFWYGLDQQARGGYWDVPHQRIYKYVADMKYTDNHNHPHMRGIRSDFIKDSRRKTTEVVCYHTGFCKKRKNMRDKQDYYYNRGEKATRPMYSLCREAWFDWLPEKELPCSAKVLPYSGPIPRVLKEHPIFKEGAGYVRS